MDFVIIIFLIIVSYLLVNFNNQYTENFFPYPNDYSYQKEYETPKNINKKSSDKRCENHFALNGICYPDMPTCTHECRKYVPNGLQNNNYCLDNYDGEVICYPPTW